MQVVKTKASSHKPTAKPPKPKDCPYCKSELSASEKDFFPCSCTFQACGNCFEDILGNKGLCPSCHKPLRASRPKAAHVSKKEEIHKPEIDKIKTQKKHTVTTVVTTVSSKHGATTSHSHTHKPDPRANLPKMSFSELSKLRIIQRNLIYIIGLAPQIAKPEILEKFEYFGQYGKINKIVVNKGNAYNSASASGPSFSAYITFAKEIEASIAIMAADQYVICDRTLRTSYGTTKYCTFFLKGQSCPNSDCLYLHTCENKEELLIKDETLSNKEIFMDQQKLTLDFIEKNYDDVIKKCSQDTAKNAKSILPSVTSVQQKAKKLIEQRNKDRPSVKTRESARSRENIDDCNKENRNSSNFDLSQSGSKRSITDDHNSHQDTESARGSLSPQKTTRQESKAEGTSEAALHSHRSHRSTSSNWSTTDNSLKKDNKEDLEAKISPKMQPERKTHEDSIAESENLRKVSMGSIKPKSSLHDLNDEPPHKKDDGFKDLFDKTVYERVSRNIYQCKVSRFAITQEEEGEEEKNDNGEYEEFNDISRSITDFVINESETYSESASSTIENKEAPSPISTSSNQDTEKILTQKVGTHAAVDLVNSHNKNMMKAKSDKIKMTESPKNIQKGENNSGMYKNGENGEGLYHVNAKHHVVNKSVELKHSDHSNIHHQRSTFSKGVTQKLSNFY